MSNLYKLFSKDWEDILDYSEDSLYEMYYSEIYGLEVSPNNGYYVGKKWLNVQVDMWLKDIHDRLLFKQELYDDPMFSEYHWWLDKILKNVY